jgi:glyoxylase-like metal-dependent hydrolase (beta-lactamase superfamily II)
MNLEDHLGDVLMKARLHAGVSAASAAKVGGATEAAWSALEATGRPPAGLDYEALGTALGLSPSKLTGLARGWKPAPIEAGHWRELRQITTHGSSFSVNCYLVWDEVTRDAALFDTGFDAGPVQAIIETEGLNLRHLFITHSHGDHVAALAEIRSKHPKVRLHASAKDAPVEQRNRASDFVHLGNLRITHRETPGHAEDGVTYVIGNWPEDAPHVAVVGDALFAGSMGRVPGDAAAAREIIRTRILALPPATLLCPGHGPMTTVAEEVAHNPFF